MKTEYPQTIKKITNAGMIICLLMTTMFSVGFTKTENIEAYTMNSKGEEIESVYITEQEKLEALKIDANQTLEKAVEKIKKEEIERKKAEEARKAMIVYDGLTLDELSAKLERSLNSTLKGQGKLFAEYSINLGLDPYLALAITLHETGCKWTCSTLVRQCYNVGGMKGSPGCNGGSYKAFNSMEEGIKAYLNNLYYNYYAVGLTTPETIGPKYAASTTWSSKINYYINEIRAS